MMPSMVMSSKAPTRGSRRARAGARAKGHFISSGSVIYRIGYRYIDEEGEGEKVTRGEREKKNEVEKRSIRSKVERIKT